MASYTRRQRTWTLPLFFFGLEAHSLAKQRARSVFRCFFWRFRKLLRFSVLTFRLCLEKKIPISGRRTSYPPDTQIPLPLPFLTQISFFSGDFIGAWSFARPRNVIPRPRNSCPTSHTLTAFLVIARELQGGRDCREQAIEKDTQKRDTQTSQSWSAILSRSQQSLAVDDADL